MIRVGIDGMNEDNGRICVVFFEGVENIKKNYIHQKDFNYCFFLLFF
jgi:hypothetical protein